MKTFENLMKISEKIETMARSQKNLVMLPIGHSCCSCRRGYEETDSGSPEANIKTVSEQEANV
jgi:hypothetical protein